MKANTPATLPTSSDIIPSEEHNSPAPFMASRLIADGLECMQTEDELDRFEAAAEEFIDQYGLSGIASLNRRLLDVRSPDTEPLARKFMRALGRRRTPTIDAVLKRILIAQLHSTSGGRRSAAATALGAFPSIATLTAMEYRSAVEQNRFVLATIRANIRVFRSHGISAAQAV